MNTTSKEKTAVIANKFIQYSRYKLTLKEQRLILYMATLIKPEDSDFATYLVPVHTIREIIEPNNNSRNSYHKWISDLTESITRRRISFPTNFTIEGKVLEGHVNWVSGAIPRTNEAGELCIEFSFGPQMKPFLLGLKERFTKFIFTDLIQLNSTAAMRIYQMCKSFYYERLQHGDSILTVALDEFKARLGMTDEYARFCDFNRRVIKPAIQEINQKTSMEITVEATRNRRRKVVTLTFYIVNNKEIIPKLNLSEQQLNLSEAKIQQLNLSEVKIQDKLSTMQLAAYHQLKDFGLSHETIIRDILPLCKAKAYEGFEDWYFDKLLCFFRTHTNTNNKRDSINAFMSWVRNKKFDHPTLRAKMNKELLLFKKNLPAKQHDNRRIAQSMSRTAYRQLINKKTAKKHHPKTANTSTPTKAPPSFNLSRFAKNYTTVYEDIVATLTQKYIALLEGIGDINTKHYNKILKKSIHQHCKTWYNENVLKR